MKKVTNFKDYMEDKQRVSAEEREAINIEKSCIVKTAEAGEDFGIEEAAASFSTNLATEDALDEADQHAKKQSKRMSHDEVFSGLSERIKENN